MSSLETANRLLKGEGEEKKRGRPRKSTTKAAAVASGLPTQAELKRKLGKDDYDILIGKVSTFLR